MTINVAELVEDLPPFVTRAELAELFRCQKNFISLLIKEKEIEAFQRRSGAGSRILIPRASVLAYLERSAI
jgi:excisionase family DNA binding protein